MKRDYLLESIKEDFAQDKEIANLIELLENEQDCNKKVGKAILESKVEAALYFAMQNKYRPKQYSNYVVCGIGSDEEKYDEDGSCETYCCDCIGIEVASKKRDYFQKRNMELGKLYEAKEKGFFRQVNFRFNKKTGKAEGSYVKKVRVHSKYLKAFELKIKKDYPITMGFGYRYTHYNESEGFESCDLCGEIIETSVIFDKQEVQHWIDKDNNFGFADYEKYQLSVLFDNPYCHRSELGFEIATYIIARNYLKAIEKVPQ